MAEKRYMVTPLFWLQAEKKSKAVSMLGKNRVFDFEGKNPPFFGAGISKKKITTAGAISLADPTPVVFQNLRSSRIILKIISLELVDIKKMAVPENSKPRQKNKQSVLR